jgi:drug/metabolite transporter (DMT)-like permease
MSGPGVTASRSFVAIFWLVVANLLWAGQGIAVKILGAGLHPIAIALLPLYLVTLLLFPLVFWRRKNASFRLRNVWKYRYHFLTAGVAGQLLAQVGMTLGIARSLASNGAILSSLVPIFSALLASLLLRERLTVTRVGALALGVLGVVLLSPTHWSMPAYRGVSPTLSGNLLIAAGCLGSAFYNVYSKRLLNDFSEIEILFFSYVGASIFSIPLLVSLDPGCCTHFTTFSVREWEAFSFLAIFMYGVSMLLFLYALRRVDVIAASASLYLVPVFGVALAMMILGEKIAPQGLLGFGIVLIGMCVAMRSIVA